MISEQLIHDVMLILFGMGAMLVAVGLIYLRDQGKKMPFHRGCAINEFNPEDPEGYL